jgi:hypothetical protein
VMGSLSVDQKPCHCGLRRERMWYSGGEAFGFAQMLYNLYSTSLDMNQTTLFRRHDEIRHPQFLMALRSRSL